MAKRVRISLIDNRAVIERLLSLTGTKTNRALAKRLDVTPLTISNWIHRGRIDYDLIFNRIEDIDINWLIYGKQSGSNKMIAEISYEKTEFYRRELEKERAEKEKVLKETEAKLRVEYETRCTASEEIAAFYKQQFEEKKKEMDDFIREWRTYLFEQSKKADL